MNFLENIQRDFMFADREKENFMWALLRFDSLPTQVIPSWTGFNIEIQEGVPILKSSVQYLDCLDAPATDMSTIYQVRFTSLIYQGNISVKNVHFQMAYKV